MAAALFGRFPFPSRRRCMAFAFNTSCELRNSLARTMLIGYPFSLR